MRAPVPPDDVDILVLTAVLGASTGVASLAIAAYAVYHQTRQSRAFEAMANSNARIARSIESDLVALRDRVNTLQQTGSSEARRLALEAEKLEHRRRESEWRKQRQIWKGIGWAIQNLGEDET